MNWLTDALGFGPKGQMVKSVTAREAFESPEWLGALIGAPSFAPMRILAIAAMGESLADAELPIWRELTGGRPEAPDAIVRELWILAGRRSGKSVTVACLAAYLAGCCDWTSCLTQGERGTLPVLAGTKVQAGAIMNILRGIFEDNLNFAPLVAAINAETISLRNRVDISVRAASHRSIRGITSVGAICEEISTWLPDEFGSKNPDREILAALRPSLSTTGAPLFCIGSPNTKTGESWRMFRRHFRPDGAPGIVVANGPTLSFNPTANRKIIADAFEDDAEIAASEWNGEFRESRAAFVPYETVAAAVDKGVSERLPEPGVRYVAHVDVSGGQGDSFAMAIGHKKDGSAVLDLVFERLPPLSVETAVGEVCVILKEYGIHEALGDNYGGRFVPELFARFGVTYRSKDKTIDGEKRVTSSEYFAKFLPILSSKRCSLLDRPKLIQQFAALERRPSRTGARDIISHPAGGHDDVAVVVAAVLSRLMDRQQLNITPDLLCRAAMPGQQSSRWNFNRPRVFIGGGDQQ